MRISFCKRKYLFHPECDFTVSAIEMTKCSPQKIALNDIKTARYWSSVTQPIYRFKTVLLLSGLL